MLGNLYRPNGEQTQQFRVPLDILGRSLDHLGDFPYKDPKKARFEKPALFIRGTQSKYVPDEVLPLVGEFFPRFQLVDVNAGHWLISEQPEAFLGGKWHVADNPYLSITEQLSVAVVEFLNPVE